MTHSHPEAEQYAAAAPELERAAKAIECEECGDTGERETDDGPVVCIFCDRGKVSP